MAGVKSDARRPAHERQVARAANFLRRPVVWTRDRVADPEFESSAWSNNAPDFLYVPCKVRDQARCIRRAPVRYLDDVGNIFIVRQILRSIDMNRSEMMRIDTLDKLVDSTALRDVVEGSPILHIAPVHRQVCFVFEQSAEQRWIGCALEYFFADVGVHLLFFGHQDKRLGLRPRHPWQV